MRADLSALFYGARTPPFTSVQRWQDRTQSVQNGMRRGASHDSRGHRSSRSSVGMPVVTLRVMDVRHAAYSRSDAERPERHATRSVAR
ncbi:hypothetical protein E2N90_02545 [Pseudomonas syringae pv. tomato]|nr:hypothetical protein EIZ61_05590 [Pseudomonas syringae]TES70124.1 hypothetical protein E2N90_02545 [Pseudomonas syringae pv. tomato]